MSLYQLHRRIEINVAEAAAMFICSTPCLAFDVTIETTPAPGVVASAVVNLVVKKVQKYNLVVKRKSFKNVFHTINSKVKKCTELKAHGKKEYK